AQCCHTGAHACLDRPQRLPQLRGNLGLREAAEIRQLDHATLHVRQLGERAGDEPLGLLALDATVRGVARRGQRRGESIIALTRGARERPRALSDCLPATSNLESREECRNAPSHATAGRTQWIGPPLSTEGGAASVSSGCAAGPAPR